MTLILVVEDDRDTADLLTELLEDHRYAIAQSRGPDALALARSLQPDLILLDLFLQEVHGEDLLHCLRADPATHDLPVIVISALPDAGRVVSQNGDAPDKLLWKPFKMDKLLATIIDVLAKRRSPDAD